MTCAETLFKVRKSCAASSSLSRLGSTIPSGKTKSRRPEVDADAVDDQDVLRVHPALCTPQCRPIPIMGNPLVGWGFEIRVVLLLGELLTKTREPHLPYTSYTAGGSVLHANLAYTYCSYRLPGVHICLGPVTCRVAA